MHLFKMTVEVVFHGHIFIPRSSENAFIGDNIQCFMQCLLANSTVVRWLSYEGWFIRGRKQCKPKHVSSGIVVLNVMWSLIRRVSQEGD